MLEAGLITSRFLHFLAVLALFGAALFPLYAFRGRLQTFSTDEPRLAEQIWWILLGATLLAFLSAASWFFVTAGSMAGNIAQAADPDILSAMMQVTDFGPLWIARFAVLVFIALLLIRWPSRLTQRLLPILAALLLASLAGTGHTRVTQGWHGAVHIASDAAHLLAAGMWLGGLWPLGLVIATSRKAGQPTGNQIAVGAVLHRFSGVGTLAVTVLVASGLANTWFLVGTPSALLSSAYGQVLCAKVALFSVMAILAVANRVWLTPKIDAFPTSQRWLGRLGQHVLGEQALGLLVVALVAILGTLEPALSS